MALILDGSTSILQSFTEKPSSFPAIIPKVHFSRFNLNLYSLILSKNFLKLKIDLLYPWISRLCHQHTPQPHCASCHVTKLWPSFGKLLPHS